MGLLLRKHLQLKNAEQSQSISQLNWLLNVRMNRRYQLSDIREQRVILDDDV